MEARIKYLVIFSVLGLSAILLSTRFVQAAPPDPLLRQTDPVILTGEQLFVYSELLPDQIVGFRFDGGWTQIPIQIDERALVDFGRIKNDDPAQYGAVVYTDSNMFTGADPVARFDDNDELVFMAKDAGIKVNVNNQPQGTVNNTGVEVKITDPLTNDIGYVYLFQRSGNLNPSADQKYVQYDFRLNSGQYRQTYDTSGLRPNYETTSLATNFYSHTFQERWINNDLKINVGNAANVDILDRHKSGIVFGFCGRTEETFSFSAGAFITNKDGPVRAIRSYLGANSGKFTQRDHIFYQQRQDIVIYHRVHEIGQSYDVFDYNQAASGMTYYNDLNLNGVQIDGRQDFLTAGKIEWELVTGQPGSLVMIHRTDSNIRGLQENSLYEDRNNPQSTQCTGDNRAIGISGPFATGITCTDPTRPECRGTNSYLTNYRSIFYGPPGLGVSDAATINAQVDAPLQIQLAQVNAVPNAVDMGQVSVSAETNILLLISFGLAVILGGLTLRLRKTQ